LFILFSLKNHHEAVLPAGGEPKGRVDCCPLAALQWPALPGLMNRFFRILALMAYRRVIRKNNAPMVTR